MKMQASGAVSISSSHSIPTAAGRSLRRSHNGGGIYHLQQQSTAAAYSGVDPSIVNGKGRNSVNINGSSVVAVGSKFQPVKPV